MNENFNKIKKTKKKLDIAIIIFIIILIVSFFIFAPLGVEYMFIPGAIGAVGVVIFIFLYKKKQTEFDDDVITPTLSKYFSDIHYDNYLLNLSNIIDDIFSNRASGFRINRNRNEAFDFKFNNTLFFVENFSLEEEKFTQADDPYIPPEIFKATMFAFESGKNINGLVELWSKKAYEYSKVFPEKYNHYFSNDNEVIVVNNNNIMINNNLINQFKNLSSKYDDLIVVFKDNMVYFLFYGKRTYFKVDIRTNKFKFDEDAIAKNCLRIQNIVNDIIDFNSKAIL